MIEAVRWTVWFLAAYGALLLLAVTGTGVAFLWHCGRAQAATTAPRWLLSRDHSARR